MLFLELKSYETFKNPLKRETFFPESETVRRHLHNSRFRWMIFTSKGKRYLIPLIFPALQDYKDTEKCLHTPHTTYIHTETKHSTASLQQAYVQHFLPWGIDHASCSIWQKHQQILPKVMDFLSPPLASLSSSKAKIHPVNSHSCIWSQFLHSLCAIFTQRTFGHYLFLLFYWGQKQKWLTAHAPDITNCFSHLSCRCNSLGTDDIRDQTLWWDSSQWNSRDSGERRAPASATNLYYRRLHDHGEM